MPRKMLLLIGLVLATVLALTACATATPTTAPSQPTAKPAEPTVVANQPVTIEWWHITTAEDQKAVWQSLADEYTALHPEVTINITVLENENFKTKMTTVMQSGEPPDIFQSWGGGTMNEYANAGLLRDITPELDANNGEWRSTFGAGALGVYALDGKNYGVPWDMGMVGVFYNKGLFAQAGISAFPATWTELMDDIEMLKAAGITPMATGAGDKWPSAFIWEYLATRIGGQAAFLAAANRTGSFTDPAFVQAGEKLAELVTANAFQDGFLGATWGDEATTFGNGNAAMDVMGQWGPGAYKDNSVDKQGIGDNLAWAPFPMVEGGAGDPNDAVGGGNGFALGKNAPDAAVDFVKYLTRAESLSLCAAAGWCLPPVAGTSDSLTDPLMKQISDQLALAKYFQLYYDQYLPPAMGSVVNDNVQAIMAEANDPGTGLTPAAAAQAIEDSAKQEIK
jgi:raffinose/stachyose/melibiose transport system substrate-binding protein